MIGPNVLSAITTRNINLVGYGTVTIVIKNCRFSYLFIFPPSHIHLKCSIPWTIFLFNLHTLSTYLFISNSIFFMVAMVILFSISELSINFSMANV